MLLIFSMLLCAVSGSRAMFPVMSESQANDLAQEYYDSQDMNYAPEEMELDKRVRLPTFMSHSMGKRFDPGFNSYDKRFHLPRRIVPERLRLAKKSRMNLADMRFGKRPMPIYHHKRATSARMGSSQMRLMKRSAADIRRLKMTRLRLAKKHADGGDDETDMKKRLLELYKKSS